MCIKTPKTPRPGASCISTTKQQQVGHLVFADLSLEERFITTSQGVINLSLGPVPEKRNNSIPGINVPYFRDNFLPGINSVPERRNSAIQGINLG